MHSSSSDPTSTYSALLHGGSRGPLQKLRRLDKSSPTFRDQISDILYGEEYKQWVPTVQGDDLVGLVDYLDKVRCRILLLRSAFKPS